MRRVLSRIKYVLLIAFALTAFLGITAASADVIKGETSLCGASYVIDHFYKNADEFLIVDEEAVASSLLSDEIVIPDNVAIAKVDSFLNIRKEASTDSEIIGYLPKDGMCIVKSNAINGWVKIESGDIEGYVSTDYLYMDLSGRIKATNLANLKAVVNIGTVNFRSTPSTKDDDNIICTLTRGDSLLVIEQNIVNKEDDNILWIKAALGDTEGYITKKYVDCKFNWVLACSVQDVVGDIDCTNITALRAGIITEAKKHIGLRYKWGGTSLTSGADCSGFCCAVFEKCGFDLMSIARTSYQLAGSSYGRKVSYEDAKPGDLVFYSLKGRVSHVAIYLGGGQIIHESSSSNSVIISDINCMKVTCIKNFID